MASVWIMVNTELQIIWMILSLIESAVFTVSWVGQGKHEKRHHYIRSRSGLSNRAPFEYKSEALQTERACFFT